MYQSIATCVSRLCRVPPQPDPPPGDENSTVVFRAAPGFWRYRTIGWMIVTATMAVLVLVGLGVALSQVRSAEDTAIVGAVGLAVIAFVGGLLALSWVTLRLDYDFRWYLVTDRSLRVREGVWIVREMTITFANVQNLSVEQGPLQRLFGISDVKVDTAGGGAARSGPHGGAGVRSLHTAWLRGVDNATEIKELIQRRIRGLRDAGLGDTDDRAVRAVRGGSVIGPAVLAAALELRTEAQRLREAGVALASRTS
jgi:membrane protein YdbS with pleckstrin-like domain